MSLAVPQQKTTHHINHRNSDLPDQIYRDMSHEDLVVTNLLEIMEEKYRDLDKEQLDAIVMLIIEHGMN